ncbi:unnamed protein product [Closterium sp. Yama58-4]|nr:unnamed protein product [Closterium sp. Yama58-4]
MDDPRGRGGAGGGVSPKKQGYPRRTDRGSPTRGRSQMAIRNIYTLLLILAICGVAIAPRLCAADPDSTARVAGRLNSISRPFSAASDVAAVQNDPMNYNDLPETPLYYHTLIQNVLAEAPRAALLEHTRFSHADLLNRAGRLSHADRSSHVKRRALQALQNVTLAPNRTHRKNPLDGLNYYTGGWNPSSKDYWASVTWSVVYAPLLGLLWLILGLGIVGFSLLTCLCCRDKWTEMRDPAYAKYTKKDLWVPLGFMLLGIVAVLVGFSVMLAGGVQLRNRVYKVTDFMTETVDFTANVVFNLTKIVETSASINITNTVIPPAKKADIESKARVANETATDLQAKTADGIVIINDALRVVTLTFSIIGCIITALCIFALLFSLLKWAVASNVVVTIIWVVVFFTWCTTAGLIIAYLVNGDTDVALDEVQHSPTMVSAMDKYLHCIPSDKIVNTTRYARYTASTVLTTANTSVATNAPKAFEALNATSGICVPYGPPPDYTRDMSYCGPGTITFQQMVNGLGAMANSSDVVPEAVKNDLAAAATTLSLLESTIPNVLFLANCSYVAEIAQFALNEVQAMVTDFQMLWIGFLVITIACMMQALSMPIYVFRAVRIGNRLADDEAEGLYKASAVPVAYPAEGEVATAPRLCAADSDSTAHIAARLKGISRSSLVPDVTASQKFHPEYYHLPDAVLYYDSLIRNAITQAPRAAILEHARLNHVTRRALQQILENVTLAPNRTHRKNPLDGLNYYTGGWDPANKDYWASVVWSVVYAPLLGLLWLILGLGIVGFSLLTCLCCRDKWTEMRDPKYAKYTKKDLWVPLGFMLLGIVAVLVGFSVMVAGGVKLHNDVNTVTQYVTEQVDFTASVIYNLSNIVETSSSITVANAVIPADKKADIEAKARKANETATELQAKTADGINLINNGLRVLSITFYTIGCIITALCILALLFSLLKWVVASNIFLTLIWVVVFLTWCMTAGLLIAYLVNGDTSVALEQVQQSPTINSAMDKYLHCIPSEKLLNATRYARYTAATVLTTANSSVASNAPRVFKILGVPGGICVPYGPAPNFTRDTSLCVQGETILFPQFVNKLMTTAGSSALVPEVVRNDLTATAQTLALLESTIPNVLTLVDCSYVANIAASKVKVVRNDLTATAQTLALLESTIPNVLTLVDCSYCSYAQAMITNFQMLWIGFLVITIACMMQALSMPIYVFRAVRIGDKLSDAEIEGLYKASAVPVAYPTGGGPEGQAQANEPSFAEGSGGSYYEGESGASYK